MPHYEFFCHTCKKAFSKIIALREYAEVEVRCPYCGGNEVEQKWSIFDLITAKKSA